MAVNVIGFTNLIKQVDEFKDPAFVSSLVRQVASVALADMVNRVADEGLAADGTKIGKYSTEPIYVSQTATPAPKAPMTGKYGSTKFESGEKKGQSHKSKYYAGGYNQYKTESGRNTLGSVNLSLTRNMLTDFTLNNNFAGAPIKTAKGWGLGFRQSENGKKLDANERRFNKSILSNITKEEEKHIEDFLNEYINDLFD